MAFDLQVVQDCSDPHALADWWAETLGWEVEPSDEAFIRRMISEGHASDDDTKIHNGTLVWKEGAAIRHPEGLARAPRLLFQLVPETKTTKNRMHLDLRGIGDDRMAVVESLVARGARVLHEGSQGPHRWTTLADPEGNEFCV